MRLAQRSALLVLALLSVNAWSQTSEQKLTVTGKLVRVMAIGGESTGWAIELSPAITVDGKQVSSLQVRYRSASKLEKLENRQVRATGTLTQKQGVESGEQLILNIASLKETNTTDKSSVQPKTQVTPLPLEPKTM